MKIKLSEKKGTTGQVIGIFITILIVSVIAALTFIFVAQLKTQTATLSYDTLTVTNESQNSTGVIAFINTTNYTVQNASLRAFNNPVITAVWAEYYQSNGSDYPSVASFGGYNVSVDSSNYSIDAYGVVTNPTSYVFNNVSISLTASYIPDNKSGAWDAINTTESAGTTVVSFLTILFLAMIFSAILTVVLRFVLPFLNLGNRLGGF